MVQAAVFVALYRKYQYDPLAHTLLKSAAAVVEAKESGVEVEIFITKVFELGAAFTVAVELVPLVIVNPRLARPAPV